VEPKPVGPVFVPPESFDSISAGVLVLLDLVAGFYWKKPHFRADLAPDFHRDKWKAVESALDGKWLTDVLARDEDPIDMTLSDLWRQVARDCTQPMPSQWSLSETTLNARFALGFALLGNNSASQVLQTVLPEFTTSDPVYLALLNQSYHSRRSDFDFGQPDLLLSESGRTWLVEMKVRGSRSTAAPYSGTQYLKYMHLARCIFEQSSKGAVVHLIVHPDGGSKLVPGAQDWFRPDPHRPKVASVDLEMLLEMLRQRPPKVRRWRDRIANHDYCRTLMALQSKVLIRQVNYSSFASAARRAVPNAKKVHRQWDQLAKAAEPSQAS
jgi:hypothetical protein